jgi:hypothetical protein
MHLHGPSKKLKPAYSSIGRGSTVKWYDLRPLKMTCTLSELMDTLLIVSVKHQGRKTRKLTRFAITMGSMKMDPNASRVWDVVYHARGHPGQGML